MKIIEKKISYVGTQEIISVEDIGFEIKGLENAIAQAQELKTRLEQTLLLTQIQLKNQEQNGQISED
jgi:hypothetical protein